MLRFKKYIPYVIIGILITILQCKDKEVVTIEVPEKKGSFEVIQPKPVVEYDTIIEQGKPRIVEVENPINKTLLDKYVSLKDSIDRMDLVKDAITERTYVETFIDSNQTIKVKSKVIGTLKSQTVDYTIYERQIPINQKKPKYSLYTGVNTTVRPIVSIQPNLTLQTPKMLYTVGYNLQTEALTLGASIKLF
ncbi:hypothetical protein [Costertonia aggregata]|uniref:Uncharacterized protein n=1 Tax=Costertonia aggregata TaxID=343403 RepID=A0A7H9ARP8_9FLAO|nr:hypothetical protein [Costertonia aggregata]QLG46062.1 hypothetical protein HYG79_12135 [Costertonia aggregata]